MFPFAAAATSFLGGGQEGGAGGILKSPQSQSGDATGGGGIGTVNLGGIGSSAGIPTWVMVAGVAIIAFAVLRK